MNSAPVPSVMMNGSVFSLTTRNPLMNPHAAPIATDASAAGTIGQSCWAFSTAIVIAPERSREAERQVEVADHRRQQRGKGQDEQRRLRAQHAAEVVRGGEPIGRLDREQHDQHDPRQRQGKLARRSARATTRS